MSKQSNFISSSHLTENLWKVPLSELINDSFELQYFDYLDTVKEELTTAADLEEEFEIKEETIVENTVNGDPLELSPEESSLNITNNQNFFIVGTVSLQNLLIPSLIPLQVRNNVVNSPLTIQDNASNDANHKSTAHVCSFCNKPLSSARNLLRHKQLHCEFRNKQLSFKCSYCNKEFDAEGKVNIHVARTHKPQSSLVSSSKNIEPKNPEKLEILENSEIPEEPEESEEDSSIVDIKTELWSDNYEKYYCCTFCSEEFYDTSELSKHSKIHENFSYSAQCSLMNNNCPYCSKQITNRYDMILHIRTHTGERPFCCKVCKKEFARIKNLKQHIIVHTGFKPFSFSCNVCSKSFSKKAFLKAHMKTHKNERPFSCHCYKRFVSKIHLKSHEKIHSTVREFICKENNCSRQFIRKSDLTKHMGRVHKKAFCFNLQ